jgi:hypothetical protein
MKGGKLENFFKHRKRMLIIPFCFLLLWPAGRASGETFQPVEKEFLWFSPNFTHVESGQKYEIRVPSLGSLSFKNYFDRYGAHPSHPFLSLLKEKNVSLAQIEDGEIVFGRTGKRIPLNRSLVPSWANPVPPYLLATPNQEWVLVVYPYYVYLDKENRYVTEVYHAQGIPLMTLESLPTHVSRQDPDLLISPERSGCCESLKWTIRFYNLKEGSVSEYSCPEGFCGDILFTKLGDKGPFIIAQEIVGKVGEIGASMQTNFYVVENDGKLSASGKILFMIREPNLEQKKLESLSPFAISNLISMEPLPGKEGWVLHFSKDGQGKVLRLASNYLESPPAPVFLLPKDPSMTGKRGIKIGDRYHGRLPLLGVVKPGRVSFEIFAEGGQKEKVVKEIRSDFVNILAF